MKFMFCIALVLSAIGCTSEVNDRDSETDTVFANECLTPGASYEVVLKEKSNGTCGPLSPVVINIGTDGTVELEEGCSNGPKSRNERCSVFMDQVCEETVRGYEVETSFTGKVDWNEDGSGGTGTYTITQTIDGEHNCRSTYAASATRL